MTMRPPLSVPGIIATLVGVASLMGMTIGAANYFENKADAERVHARIERATTEAIRVAESDRELGDLRTRLRLVMLEIQRYQDLSDVRQLTEAERIDLRSLEAERDVLQQRLVDRSRTT